MGPVRGKKKKRIKSWKIGFLSQKYMLLCNQLEGFSCGLLLDSVSAQFFEQLKHQKNKMKLECVSDKRNVLLMKIQRLERN